MIYVLQGKIVLKNERFFVVSCGGIGFKVFSNLQTLAGVAADSREVTVFTSLFVKEDRLELYGFLEERILVLFELFNTVSGVGPRMALAILDAGTPVQIATAIIEKRADFFTHVSGIGKKTSERLIIELQDKMKKVEQSDLSSLSTSTIDHEVEDVLVGLGYSRQLARRVLEELETPAEGMILEERLRVALKKLGGK